MKQFENNYLQQIGNFGSMEYVEIISKVGKFNSINIQALLAETVCSKNSSSHDVVIQFQRNLFRTLQENSSKKEDRRLAG